VLRKLRLALVESYVGAIALGMLFAQGIGHFASIFSSPIGQWVSLRTYRGFGIGMRSDAPVTFSVGPAVPELIRTVVYFAVGYALLRWLYYKPVEIPEPTPEQDAE
jgi:hypothetical protein